MNRAVIDIHQAQQLITAEKVIILDASIDKVNNKLDQNKIELIPGSQFMDIEGVFSDHNICLPHMMIDAGSFEHEIRALGIDNNTTVLIYDRWGVYSSPRAWWMFKYMGHDNVYIINGGVHSWKNAGLAVSNHHEKTNKVGNFKANPRGSWIINKTELKSLIGSNNTNINDARSKGRFEGTSPEPRQGLQSGHIPGSNNIPFDKLIDGIFLKNKQELHKLFSGKVSNNSRNIFTCGSGITASILAIGAYEIGIDNLTVYDGSWSEWAADPTLKIETS